MFLVALWALSCGESGTDDDDDGGADAGDAASVPEPHAPPPACEPTAGGPFWVLEYEAWSTHIVCATGLAIDGSALSVEGLADGATYDPAGATIDWVPGLDQGGSYEMTLRVPDRGETGSLRVGVLDRWDHWANEPVDPSRYVEEYGLPVVHLATSAGINSDDYTPATITFRGHAFAGEAKYRGGASLGYPKLSYTLKFPLEDPFREPASGFVARRKVVLTSTFDDNSYLRQRLAFEMWNRLDPEHLQIRQASVIVFVDGEYQGLYALTDHVDRFLMRAHGLSGDGNLYKAIDHDANFRLTSIQNDGAPKVTLHDGYEKKEGLPAETEVGAFDDLEELVTFVATSSPADFLAEVGLWVDQRDYEDWWIFVSFIEADDSAGKNSYHYHDLAGGPWRYAPWDFNHSFGQTWQTERAGWGEWPEGFAWANELFTRMLAEPTIAAPLRDRYGEVLTGPYAERAILELFDAMAAEVHDSALRDEERWAEQMRSYGGWNWRSDFTTHEEEIGYVRSWIPNRWAFVDRLY